MPNILFTTLAAVAMALSFCPALEAAKINDELNQIILKTAHENTNTNHDGPKIIPTKVKGPKELENQNCSVYTFSLSGFPVVQDKHFTLYTVNGIGVVTEYARMYIDSESRVFYKDLNPKSPYSAQENFIWVVGNVMAGEPIDYVLISDDRKIRAAAHIVAKPIECFGPANEHLRMELRSKDGFLYFVYGENFKPHEQIILASASEKEEMSHKIAADEKGGFFMMLQPAVIGIKNGKGKVKVMLSDGTELSLSFVWGIDNVTKTMK